MRMGVPTGVINGFDFVAMDIHKSLACKKKRERQRAKGRVRARETGGERGDRRAATVFFSWTSDRCRTRRTWNTRKRQKDEKGQTGGGGTMDLSIFSSKPCTILPIDIEITIVMQRRRPTFVSIADRPTTIDNLPRWDALSLSLHRDTITT